MSNTHTELKIQVDDAYRTSDIHKNKHCDEIKTEQLKLVGELLSLNGSKRNILNTRDGTKIFSNHADWCRCIAVCSMVCILLLKVPQTFHFLAYLVLMEFIILLLH